MSRNRLLIVVSLSLAALVAAIAPSISCAAKQTTKLEIGAAAPEWKNLPGTDGKDHSLADYKDAKLLVVVFTCNRCPVAKAYEDRLIALQKDYGSKGVQLVAINCNTDDADALPAMKQRATDKSFDFPYLYDETQKSGRDYGARVTPHVFLLDAARKVAYKGAVDDNMDSDSVKQHYLTDALDALLSGKTVPKTVTLQFGCGIAYH